MPTITFKVKAEEARRLRAMAKSRGLSVSDLIRQQTLYAGKAPGAVRRVRCRFTGATLFRSPAGAPALTTESVRELLADFP